MWIYSKEKGFGIMVTSFEFLNSNPVTEDPPVCRSGLHPHRPVLAAPAEAGPSRSMSWLAVPNIVKSAYITAHSSILYDITLHYITVQHFILHL